MTDEDKKIMVPMDLAARLTSWHSSMSDPIYAVSSHAIAGHAVDELVFRRALANMMRPSLFHSEHQQEVEEITCAMQSLLGEGDIRKIVTHAMARYLWASAWADKVEGDEYDGDEMIHPGDRLIHVAPETDVATVAFASRTLSMFEKMNGKSIEEMFKAAGNPPDAYEYGERISGKCLGLVVDGIGGYETPTVDSFEISSRLSRL